MQFIFHSKIRLIAVFVIAACWLITISMAVDFSAMSAGAPASGTLAAGIDWRSAGFLPLFVMWAVMMAAMMLPSFTPAAAAFARLLARRTATLAPKTPSATAKPATAATALLLAFIGGYVVIWGGFSVIAAIFQLSTAQQLSTALYLQDPFLRAALLFAAGAYQFTSFKFSCLKHCRHPIFFFLLHWQEGIGGAWRMGLRHGLFCLGCCWLLMLLLFAGGVMDLRWIALLTLYVLAEKLLPFAPQIIGRFTGGLLLAGAAAQIAVSI